MRINKELLKGSTSILVLSLLKNEPMYGYQIIKELESRSDGIFQLKEGTLYPLLHTLESAGMVEAYWSGEEGTRRRKYYRISDNGKKALQEKTAEWATFRSGVEKIIGEVNIAWD